MLSYGEIYTAGKNFTLPPAVLAVTNLTSANMQRYHWSQQILKSCRWARNYIFCNKNAVIDRCCDKNAVIARFRNKNALIGRFREFFLFVWQKSHDMSW